MKKAIPLSILLSSQKLSQPASINNSRSNLLSRSIVRFAFMLTAIIMLFSQGAFATHFRYGHLTWQKVSGNTVRFTLVDAFRRSGYGAPNVGDIITEVVGNTNLFFGDGSSTPTLLYKVIAVDPADDWIIGQALDPLDTTKTTIDHTYATPDSSGVPWVAEVNTGTRTSLEVNNPLGYYRLVTYVETNSGNRSPVSGLPAIVTVKQGINATFAIPATDADPNTALTFRLATSAEAAGFGTFIQPTGLSINSNTGIVSWNTGSTVAGQLYSCQVIIEDHNASTGAFKTQVAVDFLIEIVSCANDQAPVFVSPSPVCSSTINATELQPLSFTVQASDPDANDMVTLNTGGLPSGATSTPTLPTSGNPTSAVFNWTPLIGAAGNYVVVFTATDDCGIQTICNYTIHVTACNVVCNLGANFSKTATTCFGVCDGALKANPSNGVGPYSYLWSNTQTTQTATGLCKGIYTVTITDSRGCKKTASSTITSPTAVKVTAAQTNVKCKGECNGTITARASGGTVGTGYHYNWSNGETTSSITGLCKGTYTLTVTDSKGCSGTISKTITEPAKRLSVVTTKTVCSICAPNCNGTATAVVTGGTPPYTYVWSNGATTKKITSLCAGHYIVTVTDKNGCTDHCEAVLSASCCNIIYGATLSDNSSCTTCNGSINLVASGGSGIFLFVWSDNYSSNNGSRSNLCADDYDVTITDVNNPTCKQNLSFTVQDDIQYLPEISSNLGDNCPGGSTGSFEVLGLDGLNVTYLWSNNATTNPLTDVPSGTYTVTVTGENGCTATLEDSIADKTPPDIMPSFIDCHNACTGEGVVLNDGDYTSIEWSNGSMTAVATGLCAGVTTVSVTDYDGCKITYALELDNPDTLIASCSVVTPETAPGAGNGSLLGSASGGTEGVGYNLLWSNGAESALDSNLTAGNYTLTVTDKNGCTATTTCEITLICDLTVSCYYADLQDGRFILLAQPQNGTPGYSYVWNIGETTQTFTTLIPPPYTVTITDASGCIASSTCFQDIRSSEHTNSLINDATSNIYPNPFSDGFVIRYSGDDEFKVTVSDPRGRIVNTSSGLMKEAKMGDDLAPGVYMIYIESADGYRSYQKILKIK